MSIKDSTDKLKQADNTLKTAHSGIKSAITNKKVDVPDGTKFSGYPQLISQIDTGAKVELVITAPDYEGQTLTATKGSKKVTGQVVSGTCRIPVDEEGVWKVSATDGQSITIETDMTFEGEITASKTYGIKITASESSTTNRVTYIDDASGFVPVSMKSDGTADLKQWSNSWIFKKIYPVMLNADGSVAYKLDPNNQTLRLDGQRSDVSNENFNGNAMVCIEKFYTKYSMSGEDRIIELCDTKKDGFEAIGFIREDGSEADCVYMPMFFGTVINNKLRSLGDQKYSVKVSYNNARTYAQSYGTGFDIEYYSIDQVLSALYKLLTKSTSSTYIGTGRKTSTSTQTGLTMEKGPICKDTTTNTIKFLWMEDFLSVQGSVNRWENGGLGYAPPYPGTVWIKMHGPYYKDKTDGYTAIPDYIGQTGFLSKLKCSNQFGEYPFKDGFNGAQGSQEDSSWNGDCSRSIYFIFSKGGMGISGRYYNQTENSAIDIIGAALTYLPPA